MRKCLSILKQYFNGLETKSRSVGQIRKLSLNACTATITESCTDTTGAPRKSRLHFIIVTHAKRTQGCVYMKRDKRQCRTKLNGIFATLTLQSMFVAVKHFSAITNAGYSTTLNSVVVCTFTGTLNPSAKTPQHHQWTLFRRNLSALRGK